LLEALLLFERFNRHAAAQGRHHEPTLAEDSLALGCRSPVVPGGPKIEAQMDPGYCSSYLGPDLLSLTLKGIIDLLLHLGSVRQSNGCKVGVVQAQQSPEVGMVNDADRQRFLDDKAQ
jgi:hypothetical protein